LCGARQDDLRAARVAIDVEAARLDRCRRRGSSRAAPARASADGLGLADIDDQVAALEAADDAGDDLALAVLVLVVHVVALGLADALVDHLLGGLRGDAAELLDAFLRSMTSPNFSSCSFARSSSSGR
jgi:hypothetical protein